MFTKPTRLLAVFITCSVFVAAQPQRSQRTQAQPNDLAEFVKANYTKYEYRISMRDGVHLFTAVYVPKDSGEKWPIMLTRTPYTVSPYGVNNYKTMLGPSEKFTREKFIFVYQDVRGRYMSEGTFVDVRPYIPSKRGPHDVDESSDTYDTIDWIVKNVPNNNGRVGGSVNSFV